MKQDHLSGIDPAALEVLETLVAALGAGISVWGALHLMEGYETGDPELKEYGLSLVLQGSSLAACAAGSFRYLPELLSGDDPDLR